MERLEVRAGGVDVGRGIGSARSSHVRGTTPARIAVGALAVLLSFGAVPDEDTFERALSLATEKRYAEAREVLDAVLDREAANARRRVAALDRLGYAVRSRATEAAPVDGYELEARTRGAATAFEADWASRFPERPLQVVDCG